MRCSIFLFKSIIDDAIAQYLCIMKQSVYFSDLGMMDYKTAWELQEKILFTNVQKKRISQDGKSEPGDEKSSTTHHLLFVEHPPVYTLGKSGKIQHVLINEEERSSKGIEFYNTNRGGDITFHGPGQLVAYPIFDLEKFGTDIGKYLRNLEEVIIRTLADYGLEGERSQGETGVWLESSIRGRERKICAIGVRCSRWITMHGFAFNVNTNLNYFNHIIPCGIGSKKVTSLQQETGSEIGMREVKLKVMEKMEEVFNVKLILQPVKA